jgi:hypothetical protein
MAQAFPVTGASSGVEEEVHAVLQRSIAGSLAWIVGILAPFAPLSSGATEG